MGNDYKIAFGTGKRKKIVDLKDDKVFRTVDQYEDTERKQL